MKTRREFDLQRAALPVVIAAAFSAQAMAAGSAGVAQFTAGDVTVLRANGKTESLSKGKPPESGESILTGSYQLAGGTAYSSTHGAGQLVGGAMTANFGSASQGYAYVDLTTRFGGADYFTSLNVDINGAKISGSAGVTGFFTGNNASRAALVYSTSIENAGQVSGAAVFRQTALGSPPS
jgi:hypothetical protein